MIGAQPNFRGGVFPHLPSTYEQCVARARVRPSGLWLMDEAAKTDSLVDRTYAASLTRSAAAAVFRGASSVESAAGNCTMSVDGSTGTGMAGDRIIGFDDGQTGDSDPGSALFALYFSSGGFLVRNSGTIGYTGTRTVGDVISLARDIATGALSASKNGTVVYTSAVTSTVPLYVVGSLYAASSVVRDIRFSIGGVITPITWTNVNAEIAANSAVNNLAPTVSGDYPKPVVVNGRRGIQYLGADKHSADVLPAGIASTFYACCMLSDGATSGGTFGRLNSAFTESCFIYWETSVGLYTYIRDSGTNGVAFGAAGSIPWVDASPEYILAMLQIDRAATVARIAGCNGSGQYVYNETSIAGFASLDGAAMLLAIGDLPGVAVGRETVTWALCAQGSQVEGAGFPAQFARDVGWL